MSRRKAAPKKQLLPDPLFGSDLIAKFINVIMLDGKKSVAEKIVYGSLEHVSALVQKDKALQDELMKLVQPGAEAKKEVSGESSTQGESAAPVSPSITQKDIAEFLKVKEINFTSQPKTREIALLIFKKALDKVRPVVEVRSRRIGGANYQIPMEVPQNRRTTLGMRWIKEFASKRGDKTMVQRLGNEILDALSNRGGAVKKRDEVYRMAEANRAFAHYRW